MVGPKDGILGMEREAVLRKFKTQLLIRFEVDKGKWQFHGLFVQLDDSTGKAKKMEKIRLLEDEWIMS